MPGRFSIERRELIRGSAGRPARLVISTVEDGISKSEALGKLRKLKTQHTPYTIFKLAPTVGKKADQNVDPGRGAGTPDHKQ